MQVGEGGQALLQNIHCLRWTDREICVLRLKGAARDVLQPNLRKPIWEEDAPYEFRDVRLVES